MHAPLFAAPDSGARRILDGVPDLVDRVFPLPGRFRAALPRDVAELSRAFTGGRGGRGASYLGKPAFLSAYLRYFLPWNLYRLCRLLPGLPLSLKAGDTVTDIGAGPLTLPAALWIARPELRTLPLTFRCVDQTGTVLEAGKRFFAALTAGAGQGARPAARDAGTAGKKTGQEPSDCPWKIQTIRRSLPEWRAGGADRNGPRRTDRRGGPAERSPPHHADNANRTAALVTAVNFFNELYWDIPHTSSEALRRFAENSARRLAAAVPSGAVLVVEPGVPRAGEFIAALRDALAGLGYAPAAPCPHAGPCPLPGGREGGTHGSGTKRRWCHFAFDTGDAPPALLKLSAAAGLPKERASLSFLLTGAKDPEPFAPGSSAADAGDRPVDCDSAAAKLRKAGTTKGPLPRMPVRILSDPFPLPGGRSGSYGCSERGLVLVMSAAGNNAETPRPGALPIAPAETPERRDPKSGALVIEPDSAIHDIHQTKDVTDSLRIISPGRSVIADCPPPGIGL